MSDATAQAAEAASETYTMNIERIFKAPRSLVYEAFTEPHRLQAWWGPPGCQSTVHALDVRVGGAYRIEMHMPAGTVHFLSGVFREVDPPQRLVYSWTWEQGDLEGLEMTVTLEFS